MDLRTGYGIAGGLKMARRYVNHEHHIPNSTHKKFIHLEDEYANTLYLQNFSTRLEVNPMIAVFLIGYQLRTVI